MLQLTTFTESECLIFRSYSYRTSINLVLGQGLYHVSSDFALTGTTTQENPDIEMRLHAVLKQLAFRLFKIQLTASTFCKIFETWF